MSIIVTIIAWIMLGLAIGFVARKILGRADGSARDALLGIGGAVLGGVTFGVLGPGDIHGLNLPSMLAGIAGAVLVLFLYHMTDRRPVA